MSVRVRRTRTRTAVLGALLVIVATLGGCMGQGQIPCACGGQNLAPEWYTITPEDPDLVYVAASASSQKMMGAVKKATENARKDFATALDAELAQDTRIFTDSLGDARAQQFTDARKAAADTLAMERAPKEKEVLQEDNGTWRAFVLIEVPVTEGAQALLAKLEEQETLYTRFRESSSYQKVTEAAKEPEERAQEW